MDSRDRMAVGAKSKDVLRQFLVEAIVLCLTGGALGIAAGLLGSWAIQIIKGWPTETSLTAIVLAVTVSGSVGILFGFYPAWKAYKMDPIEALRTNAGFPVVFWRTKSKWRSAYSVQLKS